MGTPIELHKTLAGLEIQWRPQLVSQLNDCLVRVAKVQGEHFWHAHDFTDELFMVVDGELGLALRDDSGERIVTLTEGAFYVVPKGIEHKPFSTDGASILLIADRNLGRRTDG